MSGCILPTGDYAAAARAADRCAGGLAARLARLAREGVDEPSDAATALAAALCITLGLAQPTDDDLPDALALAALDGVELLQRSGWWDRQSTGRRCAVSTVGEDL